MKLVTGPDNLVALGVLVGSGRVLGRLAAMDLGLDPGEMLDPLTAGDLAAIVGMLLGIAVAVVATGLNRDSAIMLAISLPVFPVTSALERSYGWDTPTTIAWIIGIPIPIMLVLALGKYLWHQRRANAVGAASQAQ